MMDIMNWTRCEREFIRKVERDDNKITSLVATATKRMNLLKTIKVNPDTVSFIIEGYYEVIKELLVAYLLKNWLKSSNHQCLISYFYKENNDKEYETDVIAQLSYYRNRLDYYGELIPIEIYEKYKEDIPKIIRLLRELVEVDANSGIVRKLKR